MRFSDHRGRHFREEHDVSTTHTVEDDRRRQGRRFQDGTRRFMLGEQGLTRWLLPLFLGAISCVEHKTSALVHVIR